MLARIADLAPDATSDRSGSLLRFADRGQREEVRARLAELGYRSEELSDPETQPIAATEWYKPADLSLEEARVLASEIVPAFIREHAIDPALSEALRERVDAALFGCFVANPLDAGPATGSLQNECATAVARATGEIVGTDVAQALGLFVDRRLAET